MKNETTFLSVEKKKKNLHQKCWKQFKQRMHYAEGHESMYILQKNTQIIEDAMAF